MTNTGEAITFRGVTPILRIFDEAKAREFYVDWLGFKVDWEHRYADDMPLYMQVSRGTLVLHLSEHHGDGSPGMQLVVDVDGLDALHAELNAKRYKYGRPGIVPTQFGTRDLLVHDPFSNKIRFSEAVAR
jgi:catechol 2,3-dioxygenase-like lactoylglutathione lyase family enzyme